MCEAPIKAKVRRKLHSDDSLLLSLYKARKRLAILEKALGEINSRSVGWESHAALSALMASRRIEETDPSQWR